MNQFGAEGSARSTTLLLVPETKTTANGKCREIVSGHRSICLYVCKYAWDRSDLHRRRLTWYINACNRSDVSAEGFFNSIILYRGLFVRRRIADVVICIYLCPRGCRLNVVVWRFRVMFFRVQIDFRCVNIDLCFGNVDGSIGCVWRCRPFQIKSVVWMIFSYYFEVRVLHLCPNKFRVCIDWFDYVAEYTWINISLSTVIKQIAFWNLWNIPVNHSYEFARASTDMIFSYVTLVVNLMLLLFL